MAKNELVNNLGTFAKYGTKTFMESMASGGDISLIDQFGVDLYSCYLVSDKVECGTKITCYPKQDQSEFLEVRGLKDLVTKLSEFIGFPIELYVGKLTEKVVTDS